MKAKINLLIILIILSISPANFTLAADFKISLIPNDSLLESQNYLNQIKAFDGWEIRRQSPEVVIAVIDSGVDIDHPDLENNIWRNKDEIDKDGIDNDQNGYIDDVSGWDFVLNLPDPKPKFAGKFSSLGINHGTLVSGVIGAVANNNVGIAGVTWQVKIMPLKVMDGEGSGNSLLLGQAIRYAIDNGADIINLSMVGTTLDENLEKIIDEAYQKGLMIVAAAGNETSEPGGGDISHDLSKDPFYPICQDGEEGKNNVLGVGSVDAFDRKSRFSNYGHDCLDLVAPGENFYGTLFFAPTIQEYRKYYGGYWSGTSLAVPQVSAAAALVKSLKPQLSNTEIYNLLIDNTDNIDDKNPLYQGKLGSGRLNLKKVLEAAAVGEGFAGQKLIIAANGSQPPYVKIFDTLGNEIYKFLAYNENFTGGVGLAMADFDNNGQLEIITAAGKGGGPHVRVFSSFGQVINQFFAYEQNFSGGVNVTSGDLDLDGQTEIITAPLSGYQPEVRVFDQSGNLKSEFLAFEKTFTGGVNLTTGDINGDGQMEILAAAGPGRAPEVRVFDQSGKMIYSFLAYPKTFTGGVKIISANLFSDLRTEIVTVPQSGRFTEVKVFTSAGENEIEWSAWGAGYTGGASLAIADANNDGKPEIILGKASKGDSSVDIYSLTGKLISNFKSFGDNFIGGINLAIK
jgi:hypothetical protein